MTLAKRDTPAPGAPGITSRLLPELFAGYDEGDRITVLDLGPGNAATVNFLARFRAKVFFADLLEHPVLSTIMADPPERPLQAYIGEQLDLPENTQIDICLLWDYLHYLDLAAIEALSSVLQPMFHKHTRGYGFGALHGSEPSSASQFGIRESDSIIAHSLDTGITYHAHSQQRIGEHFLALRISRGTLLRDGRLELLFESP